MSLRSWAGLLLVPLAAATARAGEAREWSIRTPSVEKVVFRGSVNFDNAGLGTGAMLYPAPNAAGLLAALLTHGLLNEGARKAQKEQLQAQADAMLKPYEPVLGAFTHDRLLRDALPRTALGERWRVLGAADARTEAWLVEAAPLFSMARDQRALVLDNTLRVFAPATDTPALAQAIRVVSDPIDAPAEAAWLAEEGRRLTDESARLLALSLDVMLDEASGARSDRDTPRAQKTFRYPEGGTERIERAELLAQGCRRLLLRTLRGALLSVPAPNDDAGCAPRAPTP